ncbi:MAG: type I DNA topoisomerase [Planctomycetota bacterium]|nr:type I DNA topoisomerase [Planctomycetota bacterium]
MATAKKTTAKKKKAKRKSSRKKTTRKPSKSLVIVESPAKARTIGKYLGNKFLVRHSMGHVRDLPKSRMGVDLEDNFQPKFLVMRDRKPVVDELKKALKQCNDVYLAPDPDREGEAIAWHLKDALKLSDDRVHRVTFNEITKRAVQAAFDHALENPTAIDQNRVDAYMARRILDRIVGYQLSPLLWDKISRNLSAGRVQSVSTMLIVDREREIRAFVPKEYWKIAQELLILNGGDAKMTVHLKKRDGKLYEPENEEQAKQAVAHLKAADWRISKVTHRRKTDRPPPPFKTSTLQQAASTGLRFSAKRTMMVAQQLYEGVEIGSESVGLITYMRTDSFNLSSDAITEAREHIQHAFGDKYLPDKANVYRARKGAQEAHEAIRTTSAGRTPEMMAQYLKKDQLRLYEMIWKRFVACQMTPAVFDIKDVDVTASKDGQPEYLFRVQGRTGVFDGYQRLVGARHDDVLLPPLRVDPADQQSDDYLGVRREGDPQAEQHFTKPPARFSEATLVKALEKQGIGRPSTYASIMSAIQDRGYVYQEERKFHAAELGEVVTDMLRPYFPEILDVAFTAGMEDKLDSIEAARANWIEVLQDFYGPFSKDLDKAKAEMRNYKKDPVKADRKCPECKKGMVYRWRGSSKYLACVDYPECRTTIALDRDGKEKVRELTEHKCDKCQSQMILRSGRFGKFLACSAYPDCKFTLSVDKEGNPVRPQKADVKCPECGKDMIIRRGRRGAFIACTGYPECRKTLPIKKKEPAEPAKAKAKAS